VTGADVERGIELFNRRSVDRGLREWTAEDVRAPANHTPTPPPADPCSYAHSLSPEKKLARTFASGRCWDRTSDLCRVKADP